METVGPVPSRVEHRRRGKDAQVHQEQQKHTHSSTPMASLDPFLVHRLPGAATIVRLLFDKQQVCSMH